jgi:hypothetical protein
MVIPTRSLTGPLESSGGAAHAEATTTISSTVRLQARGQVHGQ